MAAGPGVPPQAVANPVIKVNNPIGISRMADNGYLTST
jgi:hypothetical protein